MFSVLLIVRLPHLEKKELILVLIICFFFICACLVLSVSSSFWCLGRAAACDCGTLWTFLLPFFTISVIICLCMYVLVNFFYSG